MEAYRCQGGRSEPPLAMLRVISALSTWTSPVGGWAPVRAHGLGPTGVSTPAHGTQSDGGQSLPPAGRQFANSTGNLGTPPKSTSSFLVLTPQTVHCPTSGS